MGSNSPVRGSNLGPLIGNMESQPLNFRESSALIWPMAHTFSLSLLMIIYLPILSCQGITTS